jgi:hypothetical protein
VSDWTPTLPDLVGFLGVAMLIGAYAALQFRKLDAENPWYSALNALAAVLIGISLIYSFNAASFVIEIFWFTISVYGLWRSTIGKRARKRGQKGGTASEP